MSGCSDTNCLNGWIPAVQVYRKVYQKGERDVMAVVSKELVATRLLTAENYDAAWAYDPEHEMAYEVVEPCHTCKPGWIAPEQRPEQRDEEALHRAKVRRVEQGERDEDWGPARSQD